ncbi:MAG: alpha/beta hydrolase [Rhodospirillaceae bacterium]|nr:alpha/beta hydrolase [Rhodospirillaceae bacterium]MCY4066292.1 alpha/beta hydrolase [Rhodospirillaceae bacterium]
MAALSDSRPLWRTMTPAQLEREYSPSSVIGGDYAPYIRDHRAGSGRARAACRRVETLAYGDGPSNSIDIALPDDGKDCPLIVYIHGGYWQELSKIESFCGADRFCERGIAYAAVDYTLAPHAGLSQIVQECRSALATLFDRVGALGVDPERLVVAGSSAGGHLAAMCCLAPLGGAQGTSRRIAGAVLLSGVYELEPLVQTSINDAVGMTVEEARLNSPLLLDPAAFPDAVVTWGERETEEFKRQSLALGRRLQSPARSVRTFESPARNHFDLLHDMYDPGTELGRSILDLIGEGR